MDKEKFSDNRSLVSLKDFCKQALASGVCGPTNWKMSWHTEALLDHLESFSSEDLDRVVITYPPTRLIK